MTTTPPIAPTIPYLRTRLCYARFNGRNIEYRTPPERTTHVDAAIGRNPTQAIIDALVASGEEPVWIELVHCRRNDHTQLSATFWSMHDMLVDAANPAPDTIRKVLDHYGASRIAEVAIAAATAYNDVIVYFDVVIGWQYYIMPEA